MVAAAAGWVGAGALEAGTGALCCEVCPLCAASGVAGCADDGESAACCAAALSEINRAAAMIHFVVRIALSPGLV